MKAKEVGFKRVNTKYSPLHTSLNIAYMPDHVNRESPGSQSPDQQLLFPENKIMIHLQRDAGVKGKKDLKLL